MIMQVVAEYHSVFCCRHNILIVAIAVILGHEREKSRPHLQLIQYSKLFSEFSLRV